MSKVGVKDVQIPLKVSVLRLTFNLYAFVNLDNRLERNSTVMVGDNKNLA